MLLMLMLLLLGGGGALLVFGCVCVVWCGWDGECEGVWGRLRPWLVAACLAEDEQAQELALHRRQHAAGAW